MNLAAAIEAVVRDVPGVVTLYSPETVVSRAARQLLPGESALVVVSGEAAAPRIEISVGVDGTLQAPVTAATIAEAVRAALPPDSEAQISVRISRVTR